MSEQPDQLMIAAYFTTGPQTVGDCLSTIKEVLGTLEQLTPWSRPFDVSGPVSRLNCLPVDEDMSNFEDLVFECWKAGKHVFYDAQGKRTLDIAPDKIPGRAIAVSFSDSIQRNDSTNRVDIRFSIGGDNETRTPTIPYSIVIGIRNYKDADTNAAWSTPSVVKAVMHYLIDRFSPVSCSAWDHKHLVNEIDGMTFDHKLNWLSYTANARVLDVLRTYPQSAPYAQGLWIELGEDARTIESELARSRVVDMGRALLKADLPHSTSGLFG